VLAEGHREVVDEVTGYVTEPLAPAPKTAATRILGQLIELQRKYPFGHPPEDEMQRALDEAAVHYHLAGATARAAALAGAHRLMALLLPEEAQSVRAQIVETAFAMQDELRPPFQWRWPNEIFAALPPTPWVSRGLQLGPGRPTLIAGYGASAKTLAAQALALAVAVGQPAWRHFEVERGQVRHFDYEQGFRATAKRYQRLAMGMHIDEHDVGSNLQLAVFPDVFLTDSRASDLFASAVHGCALAIVDAFRGAIPGADENDSNVRVYLDHLTRASEQTGCTFVVIHHAGKPKDGHGDARTVARGSSAIFDAAGCVLLLSAKGRGEPRLVQQVKQPAEAEGGGLEDFRLAVEDVPTEHAGITGVRVVYQACEQKEKSSAEAVFEQQAQRILEFVRDNPRCSAHALKAKLGLSGSRASELLAVLVEEGRIHELPGRNGGKAYSILGTV
jgi:hypothetical protein